MVCVCDAKGSTASDVAATYLFMLLPWENETKIFFSLSSSPLTDSQKAVAVAGQETLLSRLSQSQEVCEHLKEQLEALRRHSLSLQDSCTQLQTLNTQLQVTQCMM